MKPTFLFNFADSPNYLDPRLTFERNSIGTYTDSNGLIYVAPAHAARWTCDPLTGECLGLILEGAATNRFLYSEQFNNAAWVTDTTISVTTDAAVAPDGSTSAERITAATTGPYMYQLASVTSGRSIFTISVFAKADTASFVRIFVTGTTGVVAAWFDLANQTLGSLQDAASPHTAVVHRIVPGQQGWSRCSLTIDANTASTVVAAIAPVPSDLSQGAVGSSIFVWGAQLEDSVNSSTGAQYPSSYIPTTSATVKREADNLYMPIAPATDTWFNSSAGTLVFEWICRPIDTDFPIYLGGIGNDSNNYVSLRSRESISNQISGYVRVAGTTNRVEGNYTFSETEASKAAVAWGSSEIAIVVDGSVPTTASVTTATPATTARMTIGYDPTLASTSTACAYVNMKSFAYYNKKIDHAEMMVVTS